MRDFERYQHDSAVNITSTKLVVPANYPKLPLEVAERILRELCDRLTIRYQLFLPPACMMLARGLVLGSQARKRLIVQRIYTNPPLPELKSKVEDVRRDIGAARHSEKSNSFRRRLPGLIRRAVARSSYFRSHELDEVRFQIKPMTYDSIPQID